MVFSGQGPQSPPGLPDKLKIEVSCTQNLKRILIAFSFSEWYNVCY